MCNFSPGECLAIADLSEAKDRIDNWLIPGKIDFIPLIPDGIPTVGEVSSRMRRFGFVHVTGIPEGLEVLVVSKLSAALWDLLGKHQAVVELNLYLPLSAQLNPKRYDQLSPPALHLVDKLYSYSAAHRLGVSFRGPIGILDSGINRSGMSGPRTFNSYDYTGPKAKFGEVIDGDHDLRGHGTAVARILDAVLPTEVEIFSGRIAAANVYGITVQRVALAYAHLVAVSGAAVLNLSLAPRDDEVICPRCRQAVQIEAFHSLILPFVFRLADHDCVTIMAAGNRRQVSNARHALAEIHTLALVEALDSDGRLASYSNRVDAGYAAAVRAFGGDDTSNGGRVAVFENAPSTFGTSFAAPFVTAAAYAYRARSGNPICFAMDESGKDFGAFCKQDLGVPFEFRPATLPEAQRVEVPV